MVSLLHIPSEGSKVTFSKVFGGSYGTTDGSIDADIPSFVTTDPLQSAPLEKGMCWRILGVLDPSEWLTTNARINHQTGTLYFDKEEQRRWSLARLVRDLLYNPLSPEFTQLQLMSWAVIIGGAMGAYTYVWKLIIGGGIDIVWKMSPKFLKSLGVFTDREGFFPMYHYMWICPTSFGCVLSYLFAVVPMNIPDQNDWITSVHTRGVQNFRGFWTLFILSTLGMLSGLSLGPELPLVLTAGMVGSWFSKLCKQSVLQSRILTLTASSAAIGGFFGFPMAGALFVLELPHRRGLQYYEALAPSVLSSIVAVLMNRWLSNYEVTGYFRYPALTESLPSGVFTLAVVLGLFGAAIGIAYVKLTKRLKTWVHDLFQDPDNHIYYYLSRDNKFSSYKNAKGDNWLELEDDDDEEEGQQEQASCCGHCTERCSFAKRAADMLRRLVVIRHKGARAALAGAIAGVLVGIIGIFVPHTMFWGEAQLQNLIDRGLSPLPVFSESDEPTTELAAHGFCLIDPSNEFGFDIGCSLLITVAKTIAVGLSLGTGILGGHFWGPLFVGCSAAHLFTDMVNVFADVFGFGRILASYPAIVILCVMGSSHVVTFRAHMAIMLILTLTISSFGDNMMVAEGDYSAVFPLLVIAVFVALMVSRHVVFYKAQRNRGDITAVPEVLCEPGLQGKPMVVGYGTESTGDGYEGDNDATVSFDEIDYGNNNKSSNQSVRSLGTKSMSTSSLFQVRTYGELTEHQPCLLEQARMRSASSMADSRHCRTRMAHGGVKSSLSSEGNIPITEARIRLDNDSSGELDFESDPVILARETLERLESIFLA